MIATLLTLFVCAVITLLVIIVSLRLGWLYQCRENRRCPKCRLVPKLPAVHEWWRCERCDCKYDPLTGRRI